MLKRFLVIFILIVTFVVGNVLAQEYKIGAEDILEVRFWQDQELNTEVKVSLDGMITLDIIGQIKAAGKTTVELENDIVRQISRLNARISQAVVRVVEFNYQHIFVKGQVNTIGKFTFEQIPDLWTVINEAGGISEYGDLSRVTIIRGGDESGKIEEVNILEALEKGELNKLPKIRRQDTIEIPRTLIGIPADDIINHTTRGKNVIFVIGAVNTPGPIRFEDNLDILDVLSLAGGPTADADLKKTKLITKVGLYSQSIKIDLNKYSLQDNIPRYILKDEDTFIVPTKGGGFFSLGTIVPILGVITSSIFIYNEMKSSDD
jgi:polysaccharide export outer membrane protein